jgi:6-phosphogluconate dehydrogenase
MVYNGIEDGIMAAYAEGFNILHPELSEFEGCVSDSGEGRWTLKAAIDEGVPANALSCALFGRFTSRGATNFADKLLSAMRHEFGGHTERSPNKKTAAQR